MQMYKRVARGLAIKISDHITNLIIFHLFLQVTNKYKLRHNQSFKMHFQSITLTLTFAMATGVMASPLKEKASNEMVELFRENGNDGGQLIYFGPGNDTDTVTDPLQDLASCSSTAKITCDSSHAARNEVCDKLVTQLEGYSDVAVAKLPRQICYKGDSEDDEYCCVSWHNTIMA